MARKGPRPTPTSVLKVRGSWLVRNRKGEPVADGIPDTPAWLDGVALEAWQQLVEKLHRMGLLGDIDGHALALYCEAYQEFCFAREYIKEHGMISVSEKGGEYQNPMVGIKNKAAERMNRLGSQFGWSPSARVGLKPEPKTKKDDGKSSYFTA